MNQPLLRREMIGPEEVAEDLLNAEAARRRMRLGARRLSPFAAL